MTAKQYLQQLFFIKQMIFESLQELKELRSLALSIGAVDNSKEKIKSLSVSDTVGSSVAVIVDLENTIKDKITSYKKTKLEIEDNIGKILEVKVKIVLLKRYVYYKDFDDIAHDLNYHVQHIFKLHSQGLREIEKMLVNASN